MRQFQVPQFINIEDRIIGPLTLKQFLYLAGGGAIVVLAWFTLNIVFFLLVALPAASFSAALAFVKFNGQPLPSVVINGVTFYLKPRLYLWKRVADKKTKEPAKTGEGESPQTKTMVLTESKLADLSWSLDIKEKLNR